ncbi:L-glutamate gamma-semialdehyde dehydrogenase [Alkalitalea saponilacus]|uniref:L-glutamate gamma-semialdehyde dehydrogenase n=1 Tax=Alkalitalea saponilacus TaxID=889453 RepID=A0A1T5BPE0_9BACT|nr:L-glutamate gamma-semialdehyde dehydrogenase [Alkalitalea saponilacus]ASB49633.1 1-pyrroline-5-carboxylate dehydrogenase [Alkalitalea saponilacus]SKB49152.1 delta-1-pyrroline-5-carboxylate dehydrogenase [Alkalitalea saponilacus]
MSKGFFKIPTTKNEPVLNYLPGSPERAALKEQIAQYKSSEMDIPMFIGGEEVRSGNTVRIFPPHEIEHTLGHYHAGDETHVYRAIDAATNAKEGWEALNWEERAAIFLKAADLISGPYRQKLNASTMLGQSKNVYQAEIDAACEMADFLRFNVHYMTAIYNDQPASSPGIWNRMEYRPLEGFVFALTPFNFTSIAGNLPSAPAMMGNVVIWKPSKTAIYSAHILMELFREAGLPDGVINLIFAPGPVVARAVFDHPDFAGFHFTGSTGVFQDIWKTIGNNIHKYKSYPRIVGETGGKDFIIAHKSCDAQAVATALIRGAFEYQGQKCSAVSRAYLPSGRWDEILSYLQKDMKEIKMGSPEDFRNFMNAVIDEPSFDKLASEIDAAKNHPDTKIIFGGNYDKTHGYFIEPTIILTTNPSYKTMEEELFGPILTIYVYDDSKLDETLNVLDKTSMYALTGAVFAKDRAIIQKITKRLSNAAGNFYVNDKPTGAVVGQQPFGGARGSGTNDKAGSMLNMLRWVSPRTIKENFVPPVDFKYPFMMEE